MKIRSLSLSFVLYSTLLLFGTLV